MRAMCICVVGVGDGIASRAADHSIAKFRESAKQPLSTAAMSSIAGVPLLFAASLVYVIASSIACDDTNYCDGKYGYAVSVGVISLAICLLLLVLKATGRESGVEPLHKWISLFLFVWWALGATIGTFDAPFKAVGNGYFSAWAAFLFATQYAYNSSDLIRNMIDRGRSAAMGGGAPADNNPATDNV